MGQVAFANEAPTPQQFMVDHEREGTLIAAVVPPGARSVGYAVVRPGELEVGCSSAIGERAGRNQLPAVTVRVGAP